MHSFICVPCLCAMPKVAGELHQKDCCWNGRVNNRPVARLTRSRRASDLLQTEAWFQPENMVIKQHVARQVYRWQLAMCCKLKLELRGSRKWQDLVLCSWGRDGQVSEWVSEWVWVSAWVSECVSGWAGGWASERMHDWVGECMREWMNAWVAAWLTE